MAANKLAECFEDSKFSSWEAFMEQALEVVRVFPEAIVYMESYESLMVLSM